MTTTVEPLKILSPNYTEHQSSVIAPLFPHSEEEGPLAEDRIRGSFLFFLSFFFHCCVRSTFAVCPAGGTLARKAAAGGGMQGVGEGLDLVMA